MSDIKSTPSADIKTAPNSTTVTSEAGTSTATTSAATPAPGAKLSVSDTIKRTLSSKNAKAGGAMLKSGFATAVGAHPLWLMGEAITGKKVGTQAKKGSKEFLAASQAFVEGLSTSATDILVVINEQLRNKGKETGETADVIKSAGENAIVVVTSSLVKAREQMEANSPALKRAILKNGKQVIVVVDQSLKNPVVITGVRKFAKSKGIPFSEGMMTVASLALSKLLAAMEGMEGELQDGIHELDAELLEKKSSEQATREAKEVRERVEKSQAKDEKSQAKDGRKHYRTEEEMKKDTCIIC